MGKGCSNAWIKMTNKYMFTIYACVTFFLRITSSGLARFSIYSIYDSIFSALAMEICNFALNHRFRPQTIKEAMVHKIYGVLLRLWETWLNKTGRNVFIFRLLSLWTTVHVEGHAVTSIATQKLRNNNLYQYSISLSARLMMILPDPRD